jgi:hypothetical protein
MLALCSYPAQAQYWALGFTGGLAVPVGDFGTKPTIDVEGKLNSNITATASTGFSFGFQGRGHFREVWAVGVDATYYHFPGKPFPAGVAGFTSGPNAGYFDAVSVMGCIEYYFTPVTSTWRPYASLEAGYIGTALQWEASNDENLAAASSSAAVGMVFGALYQLTNTTSIKGNIKYTHAFSGHPFSFSNYQSSGSEIGLPPCQFLSINLGVHFTFDSGAKPY